MCGLLEKGVLPCEKAQHRKGKAAAVKGGDKMSKGTIDTCKMRYIVPFSYGSGDMFAQVCHTLSCNDNWSLDGIRESEQDIYPYMLNTLLQRADDKNNIACGWRFQQGKPSILSFAYLSQQQLMKWKVSEAGLFLFRTGIGLFWYEIVKTAPGNKKMTVEELIQFQNAFKELNRRGNCDIFYELGKEQLAEIEEEMLVCPEALPEKERKRYEKCTYLPGKGPSVVRYMEREAFRRIGQQKAAFPEEDRSVPFLGCSAFWKKEDAQRKLMVKWQSGNRFSMGDWIGTVLEDLQCKRNYYPEKKNCMKDVRKENCPDFVPDKAILFQYCVMDMGTEGSEAFLDGIYHLTNGYKESYLTPADMQGEMLFLSENTCCYTTKEGSGYYVRRRAQNEAFFQQNMKKRMMTNYFLLYLHLLYQSYSLLHFAGEIQKQLSGDAEDYRETSGPFGERLERIRTDINVFLIKSVNTSVSYLDQHNLYYQYSEKRLNIRADIESITTGLHSLEEVLKMRDQRKKEQETRKANDKVTFALGLLSLFGLISICVDGFTLVGFVKEKWLFAYLPDAFLYLVFFIAMTVSGAYVLRILMKGYSFRDSKGGSTQKL